MNAERTRDPLALVRIFLKEIRIEHTLFALPFAYTGAVVAARGLPSLLQLTWITLAVLGARTAAMAANRYFDREIDARNPRTAKRALVAGTLSPNVMVGAMVAGLVLLLVSAWALNPLCVMLLPIAALGILVYPFCKRFTWLTHFVLGAVDGFAPLGAYIAIAGSASLTAFALFAAVTVWVAGFDMAYALMDLPIDREQSIRSLPARFGVNGARIGLIVSHAVMAVLLVVAGLAADAGRPYLLGIGAAIVLIAYEWSLLRSQLDVFKLNDRIFVANMIFSLVFLATTIAGFAGAA